MRKWHRWLSLPALLFLLLISVSGLVLQIQGFLGSDEEEAASAPVKSSIAANDTSTSSSLRAAQDALVKKSGDIRLRKIDVDFSSTPSTFTFTTDEQAPRKIKIEAGTNKIISDELAGSEFWLKLHSGEILGDWGRSLGIFGGLTLLFLSVSGGWIYFQMFRRRPSGQSLRKKIFW